MLQKLAMEYTGEGRGGTGLQQPKGPALQAVAVKYLSHFSLAAAAGLHRSMSVFGCLGGAVSHVAPPCCKAGHVPAGRGCGAI